MDFRPGGREVHRATLPNGTLQLIEKTFLEIVPDARIIFGYGIEADGRYLSASLVTRGISPGRARHTPEANGATRVHRRAYGSG